MTTHPTTTGPAQMKTKSKRTYRDNLITVRQLAQQLLFRRMTDYVVINDTRIDDDTLYLIARRVGGKWKLQTTPHA